MTLLHNLVLYGALGLLSVSLIVFILRYVGLFLYYL